MCGKNRKIILNSIIITREKRRPEGLRIDDTLLLRLWPEKESGKREAGKRKKGKTR
jgi:hypothetical protein